MPRRRHRQGPGRTVRTVAGIGLVIVAVVLIRDQIPDPQTLLSTPSGMNHGWPAVAVIAELPALIAFAVHHLVLLETFGVPIGRRRAFALASTRAAMTAGLPAGSAMSARFAYQRFRSYGASRSTATTVVILSGLASTAALLGVHLIGSGVTVGRHHLLPVVATLGGLTAVAVTVHLSPRLRPGPWTWPRTARWAWIRTTAARIGAVPGPRWALVVAIAAGSWLADLAALASLHESPRLNGRLNPTAREGDV